VWPRKRDLPENDWMEIGWSRSVSSSHSDAWDVGAHDFAKRPPTFHTSSNSE
jgi:hypothetical protein